MDYTLHPCFHQGLYFRIQNQIQNAGIQPEDIEPDEKMDEEYNPKDGSANKGGRPKTKNFDDLGTKMQRKRLKRTLDAVRENAPENNLTPIQEIAQAGRMFANEEGDHEKAKMFSMIANEENPLKHRKMDVADATALKVKKVFAAYRVSNLILKTNIHSVANSRQRGNL